MPVARFFVLRDRGLVVILPLGFADSALLIAFLAGLTDVSEAAFALGRRLTRSPGSPEATKIRTHHGPALREGRLRVQVGAGWKRSNFSPSPKKI
jgi:hypothetical protein